MGEQRAGSPYSVRFPRPGRSWFYFVEEAEFDLTEGEDG